MEQKPLTVVLDEMTIKEFRTFEKELAEIGERKITTYFRRIFGSYDVGVGQAPLQRYLELCEFQDGTILSRMLCAEDNICSYSMEYGKVRFSNHEGPFGGWTLTGEPIKYKVDYPHDMSTPFGEPRKEIPLPEEMLPFALALWQCYRTYIDSSPNDDRSLDEEEQEERESMDEWCSEPKEDWEERSAKISEEVRLKYETEKASRDIEQQVREETAAKKQTPVDRMVSAAMAGNTESPDLDTLITRAKQQREQTIEVLRNLRTRIAELETENTNLRGDNDADAHAADYQKAMDELTVEYRKIQVENTEGDITAMEFEARRKSIVDQMLEIYGAYKDEINHVGVL